MVATASSHSRGHVHALDFQIRSLEWEIRSGEGEAVFASESPIPAAATPLTGMDSFISISGTFPCSWFSKRSSEEGESKRRRFRIFRRRFDAFRPPAKASEVWNLIFSSSSTCLYIWNSYLVKFGRRWILGQSTTVRGCCARRRW